MENISAYLTTSFADVRVRPMSLILLTNDDGIDAPGINVLEKSMEGLGEVWTIAPDSERSACSRAVTLHRPLRVRQLAQRRFCVDGTPADCVLLGFRALLPSIPDLVVSGINLGFNIAEDLDYSGTVAGAAEGALQGAKIASISISVKAGSNMDKLQEAGRFCRLLCFRLSSNPLPKGSYLNVNLPVHTSKTIRITRQGNKLEPGDVERRIDPRGREYYWIGNRPEEESPPKDTDRGALKDGCVSLTLLTLARDFGGEWNPPSIQDDGWKMEV